MPGTSTTVSYIGSAAVTVGMLFLLALFVAPLPTSIPGFAVAPALVFVARPMARALVELNWADATDDMPAIVTALAMHFTLSIATGIPGGAHNGGPAAGGGPPPRRRTPRARPRGPPLHPPRRHHPPPRRPF